MISKPFEQIDKADILNLIANEVGEGRILDYKEILPGNSDSEKTEFLADVSSFANTAGGHILYGVRERRDGDGKPTGIPESADGLNGVNADSEILRLESIIRSSLAPRVPGFRSKSIDGFSNGSVLVLWIPKSWSGPHMVTYKNHSRFYSRSSNGKYAMDVSEIRSGFALSEDVPEKIRDFRDQRISKIITNDTPVPVLELPKIVLHLVPMSSLTGAQQFHVAEIYTRRQQLEPVSFESTSHRVNFDGVVIFRIDADSPRCDAYVQAFRNGTIEAIETAEFEEANGKKFILSLAFEKNLISATTRFLKLQANLGIPPPIFVMISLLGVKGFTMRTNDPHQSVRTTPIDRDVLLLPEIIVEEFDQEPSSLLRPVFDAVWQAAGFLRSAYYDANGNWKGPS
jgi:Schlafen, AlbA_2